MCKGEQPGLSRSAFVGPGVQNTQPLMSRFKQAGVNQGDAQDTDLMLTTDVKELQGKDRYCPCLSATIASAQEVFLKQI